MPNSTLHHGTGGYTLSRGDVKENFSTPLTPVDNPWILRCTSQGGAIELVIRFRSQGTSWPLRVGDTVEIREGTQRLEIQGELVLEIITHYFRAIELQQHMVNGTLPRKPLAPASTPDLFERRRLDRRSRRRA